MQFYIGKADNKLDVGLGENVVTRLTRDIVGQHFSMYMDNFFSSIPLFRNLAYMQLEHCGETGRVPTGFSWCGKVWPAILMRHSFPTMWKPCSDSLARQKVCSSSLHPAQSNRHHNCAAGGSIITISCPQAIANYNRLIGGVDLGDQYQGHYVVRTKSHKLYRYILCFLVKLCILHSYTSLIFSQHTWDVNLTWVSYSISWTANGGDCNTHNRPCRPLAAHVPAAKTMTIAHLPGKTKKGRCATCKTVTHCVVL